MNPFSLPAFLPAAAFLFQTCFPFLRIFHHRCSAIHKTALYPKEYLPVLLLLLDFFTMAFRGFHIEISIIRQRSVSWMERRRDIKITLHKLPDLFSDILMQDQGCRIHFVSFVQAKHRHEKFLCPPVSVQQILRFSPHNRGFHQIIFAYNAGPRFLSDAIAS